MKFICETAFEKWRAKTWLTKEPGTIAWLNEQLRRGDVFYDIGANVGSYTLLAAKLVGPTGLVVAFEPHLFTAATLLRNIQANGFEDRVQVVTSALHDYESFLIFNYSKRMAGSSGSQLGTTIDENGKTFQPECRELKHTTTLDRFILTSKVRGPNVIKIDVDGNELFVLAGMPSTLDNLNLRSLQVEIHPSNSAEICEKLELAGFTEQHRHVSSLGQEAVDRGYAVSDVFANAIFARAA